jgi:hypothetical protein
MNKARTSQILSEQEWQHVNMMTHSKNAAMCEIFLDFMSTQNTSQILSEDSCTG